MRKMRITKKTRALVNEYLEKGETIDFIARALELEQNFRNQVISVIQETKGEQYLVDNAERLGYPESQWSEDDFYAELVQLIEQWNESGYTEERLREIIGMAL